MRRGLAPRHRSPLGPTQTRMRRATMVPNQEDADDETLNDERRVRSTRRRSDMADLPRVSMEHRSIGRTFTARDGTVYRPSMFVTVTLPSYGRVTTPRKGMAVPGAGAPLDPDTYNYRRAALDALHFPKLFDRWMQNLRRCAGYQVQYFAAIEEQRRLAPHAHVALRGAIPAADPAAGHQGHLLQPVVAAARPAGLRAPHTVVGRRDRLLPRPRHRLAAADLGPGRRRARPPGSSAGARDAVRLPGRHQGRDRTIGGRQPHHPLPDQVPHQGRRHDPRRSGES